MNVSAESHRRREAQMSVTMHFKDPEQSLMTRFPEIRWREPVTVTTPDGTFQTCRLCTALYGLKAVDVPKVSFRSLRAFEMHMRTHMR